MVAKVSSCSPCSYLLGCINPARLAPSTYPHDSSAFSALFPSSLTITHLDNEVTLGVLLDFLDEAQLGRVDASIQVISPDFPLELTGFFPGKHLIQFLMLKMKDFWNFVLDNCILDFDAEQVYLKLQVTNLKNNEVQ